MVFPLFISRSEWDTAFEDYECVNIYCKYVYIHVCEHSECLYVQCDLGFKLGFKQGLNWNHEHN